jgi:hypothetical protein
LHDYFKPQLLKSDIFNNNPLQQTVIFAVAADAANLLPQMDGGVMTPATDEAPGTMTQS